MILHRPVDGTPPVCPTAWRIARGSRANRAGRSLRRRACSKGLQPHDSMLPPSLRASCAGPALACLLVVATASGSPAQSQSGAASPVALAGRDDPNGSTRLLRTPTISATHIAFAYAGNIWIVDRA